LLLLLLIPINLALALQEGLLDFGLYSLLFWG
jgi:hypothetical protein